MKNMLKYDLIRVFMMTTMAILCAIYAIYIKEDLELICKSYLFLIPITTFLRNLEYLPKYGMKKVLIKELIVFLITMVTYFFISILTCEIFYQIPYKSAYLGELFVLTTVFEVMTVMIFIKSNLKRASFAFLMILLTVIILIVRAVAKYAMVFYILYVVMDLMLAVEIYIFAKHYEDDIYLNN